MVTISYFLKGVVKSNCAAKEGTEQLSWETYNTNYDEHLFYYTCQLVHKLWDILSSHTQIL